MAKEMKFHQEYSSYPATSVGALRLGSLYYFTGKECKNGHTSLRYASSSNCVECIEKKRGVQFDKNKHRFSDENINLSIDAMANGFTSYISTSACPKGHFERFTSSNNCVACSQKSMEKRKDYLKWLRIKKLYGITEEDFLQMLQDQSELCEICKKKLTDKNTHIDHCHQSGMVRALLCSKCNQGIGLFDEEASNLLKAVEYLRKYKND